MERYREHQADQTDSSTLAAHCYHHNGHRPDHPLPQDSGPGPDQAGHVQCVGPVQSGSDENTVSVLLPPL